MVGLFSLSVYYVLGFLSFFIFIFFIIRYNKLKCYKYPSGL